MTTATTTHPSEPMRTPDGDRDALVALARRRVGRKLGFYVHAGVFVLVNAGLFLVGLSSGGAHGPHVPLWGWGIGLAIHGIAVAVGLRGDGLRDRMVEAEIGRLRRRG